MNRLLRRRQIQGARRCATAVAHLLINVVAQYKPKIPQYLLARVQSVGQQLSSFKAKEPVIDNIIRRTLGLIREVSDPGHSADLSGDINGAFNNNQVVSGENSITTVKEDVLDGMRELLEELEQADKQISEYASEQVYSGEVILTFTASLTVQKFLLDAAKRRKFSLIHVEGYPNEHQKTHDTILHGGKRSASDENDTVNRLKSLAAAGVEVVTVPDSAIFGIMARVNKVILPAQSAFSNGSFVASAGTGAICKAAKLHGIPVFVLGAIYRLSPVYPFDKEGFLDFGNSSGVIPYESGALVDEIEVVNPTKDVIEPDLVDLFISNM